MARPREFEESDVLNAALGVFWAKGYDGTSIEDLVDATGVGRASLYGAFGDKARLFARVLDHYLERVRALDAVDEGATPREALVEITSRWVGGACATDGPRGCLLQQSCAAESIAPIAKDIAARASADRQKLLESLIARGQKSGDFPSGTRPVELASFLLIVQQGIASAARAGASKHELTATMRLALDRVMGEAKAARGARRAG
ncbi:MAG: TetR/AcrR family transcriptional regulator [Polyangiaceae bacterium]